MQAVLSRARQGQPLAVGFLTSPEPIDASFGAERGSPGIVPYKAKPSLADRATLAGALTKILRVVAHFFLLSASCGWWLLSLLVFAIACRAQATIRSGRQT
jgi:hypothetical protein